MSIQKNLIKTALVFLLLAIPLSSFAEDITPEKTTFPYKTMPLNGRLNKNEVFNSNSPEIVTTDGILLSTFSGENKKHPNAHLNKAFSGEFDIFTHHIALENGKMFYQGILLNNPTDRIVKVKVISSATYLTQPESPFIKLDSYLENNKGEFYAGPGDRVNQDILREKNFIKNAEIKLKPNETIVLMNNNIPIPFPDRNGRTTLIKLKTSGQLYVADLALFKNSFLFFTNKPSLSDWIKVLENGELAEKRDKIPSEIGKVLEKGKPFIYGRVSGVVVGNTWNGTLANDSSKLIAPKKGEGISFVLNTVYNNTLGTNQVQSGKVIERYVDTAYQSHSNYGVTYELEIPLYNNSKEHKDVFISFDSPIRLPENKTQSGLSFFIKPPERTCFRGEFKIEYQEDGIKKEKFVHIVQRFGEKGSNLLNLSLKPNEAKNVKITYIYPADSTPPHVLTIGSN